MLNFLFSFSQDSSSFSFYGCLPEGWKVLLFSGITTIISERIFLDRKNFWATFVVHFTIGVACFCTSAFVMYLLVPCFSTKVFVIMISLLILIQDYYSSVIFLFPQQISS